jgi:hypothetical protein
VSSSNLQCCPPLIGPGVPATKHRRQVAVANPGSLSTFLGSVRTHCIQPTTIRTGILRVVRLAPYTINAAAGLTTAGEPQAPTYFFTSPPEFNMASKYARRKAINPPALPSTSAMFLLTSTSLGFHPQGAKEPPHQVTLSRLLLRQAAASFTRFDSQKTQPSCAAHCSEQSSSHSSHKRGSSANLPQR